MKKFYLPTQEEYGILLATLALIFGSWVRLFPPSISGFPINDGGLFTVMIEAIQNDGLRLPAYFQYNGQTIPFAYPPLAFYLSALISNIFDLNVITLIRWLPAIILVGTIPAFFYLATAILKSSYKAGLATLSFAFTPRTMTWTLMGGGLTRSFGMLFLLLSLAFIDRVLEGGQRKPLLAAILFTSLTILTHPEAALHLFVFTILFWIVKGRNRIGALQMTRLGSGTFLLTSVWWLPTILRIGLSPYLAAAMTGSHSFLSLLYPLLFNLTDETFLTITAILGLLGCLACLTKGDFFIPIFYVVPFLVDPRSSATYAMIPLSMMAGTALSDILIPGFVQLKRPGSKPSPQLPLESLKVILPLLAIGLYFLGGSIYFGTQLAGTAVSAADRAAFAWIAANTKPSSRFLVMTGEKEILCDGVQEWFPVLANRVSILTIQGREWLPDQQYIQAVNLQSEAQSCLADSNPLSCISSHGLNFDYIYIARQSTLKNFCRAIAPASRGEGLIANLLQDSHYRSMYTTPAVAIFSYLP